MPLNSAYGANIDKISRYQMRMDYMDPNAQTPLKRVFQFAHTRTGITSGDVYYYDFQAPSDKHMIINRYTLKALNGPVYYDTFEGATYTPGTPVTTTFYNSWRGYPAQESVLGAGATYISGGVIVVSDFLSGATNKVGSSEDLQNVVILPPTAAGLFRVTNDGGNDNTIRFSGLITEVLLPNYIY